MKIYAVIAAALSVAAVGPALAQPSVVLLPAGSTWRYLDDGSEQGTAWRGLGFNDSGWPSGPAQLGYGDGDEATLINGGPSGDHFITTWFRRTFVVPASPSLSNLTVHLVRDDGGIVYLNGVEIFRSNMPGGTVNSGTFASGTVGGGAEGQFFSNTVSAASLLIGTNVIAVEIHQVEPTSTDVSFNLALTAVTGTSSRPALSVQPTNTTVVQGSGAALVVGVSGIGPFGFEWRKNGQPLAGSARLLGVNSSLLSLLDTVPEDAGGYSVVVSNVSGAVTSLVATLSVLPPPTTAIDDFEPDIDLSQWSGFSGLVRATNYGGNVSPPNALTFGGNGLRTATTRALDTTAGGFISFSLRLSDGVNGEPWDHAELPGEGIVLEYSTDRGTNWTRLATYDTENLYNWSLQEMFMPPGALSPRTLFRWRQLENSGSCCDHWALDDVYIESVPFPPLIVREPADRAALEGGSATFTTEVAGTPVLHYQWSFNGVGLMNATNPSLTIHGARSNQAGLYRVSIDNALGSIASREARLTVIDGSRDTFRIATLTTNQARVVQHGSLSGSPRGGLAVSDSRLFVIGNAASACFDLADLGNPAASPIVHDAILSDLRSGAVFTLGTATGPLTTLGGLATRLLEVDRRTGQLTGGSTPLTDPIPFSSLFPLYGNIGFFSGRGRAAVHNGTNVYTIFLPSGLVLDLGPLPALPRLNSNTWAYWGVMEYFDGATWLARVEDFRTITRTRAGDGLSQTVATFRDLGGMAGITAVPASNRWYFHTSFSTELGLQPQVAGFADATFSFEQTTQAVSIAQGPHDRSVVAGASVEFTVSALGFPLNFQWLRNNTPMPGENGARLVLTAVTTNAAALYSVIVSNELGTVTSAPATLRVVPGMSVAVFDDPNYVDTFGGPFSESDAVQASLVSLGHQPLPFATSNLTTILASGRPVLIPALNFDNPARVYSLAQRQAVQNFVLNGGLLIVHGANYTLDFLNEIFGLTLANLFASGGTFPRTADAQGSAFADGPASLPANSSTYAILGSSVTLGAQRAYETNNAAIVASIPIGSGRIVFLGWDWSNARPLGTLDGGWRDVLNAALLNTMPPPPGPPAIAVQPRSRPGVVGVDVPLSVIAFGAGPMFYQWYFNSTPIAGAQSSTHTIGLPTTNSSGGYFVIISNLTGAVTSQVAQVTVRPSRGQGGYYTDFQTDSTGPELSLLQAAYTPVRLTDLSAANLAPLRFLVLSEAAFNSVSPTLLMRLPDLTAWVQNGGRLIVHDIATAASPLLLGAAGARLELVPTNALTVVPPGTSLVTAGPHGTLTNGSLTTSSANYISYTAVDLATLPAGSVPILAASPTQTVAFAYGLGSGMVYYSALLLAGYFETSLPESELLRTVYLPNVIEYAQAFTPAGPALILQPPFDAGALPNGRGVFTVFASGQAPLRYQWRFNDTDIAGATNSSLVITGANATHVGTYRVTVSNALGSTSSPPARLTLIEALAFKINSLGTSAQVVDHDALTSDDRGGIAVSSNSVFVTGDVGTARFSAANLGGGTALPVQYDALIGNLRDETVYSLALGTNLITFGGGVVDRLLQIDGTTGALTTNQIPLSAPLNLSGSQVGIFSGYDAGVVHDGVRAWRIDFHSGFVTDLGFMPVPPHQSCESWAYWGVAEFFNGAMWLVYVRSGQNISRTRVPDGQTETVATFNNLSDMCSITFSPSRDRWYFHYEGSGQFGGQFETLGFANATWDKPPSISGVGGGTLSEDASPLSIILNLTDDLTPAASLAVIASSSDSNLLSAAISTAGALRTLVLTPAPNRYGTAVVILAVSDVVGNVTSRTYPFVINPVNDPPAFTPGTNIVVNEDAGPLRLAGWATQISAGPIEPGQVLSFAVSNSNPGLFVQAPALSPAGELTFTLAPNAHGLATLLVVARDDGGVANGGVDTSAPRTVTVTVLPVNDPPAALPQTVSTPEDTSLALTLAGLDVESDPLTFLVVSPPAHGTLFGTPPNVEYRPATNYHGPDSFRFTVNDGQAESAPVTVAIEVTPFNDPPVITPQALATDEDTPLSIVLQASDPDGSPLTLSIVTPPAHGTLTGTAPNLTYLAATNFAGDDQFTFQADDGQGGIAMASLTITVRPVNDAPSAGDQSLSLDEDTTLPFTMAASDVEGDLLTFRIITPPAHGTLTGTAPNLVYSPATNYAGSDQFQFLVNDGRIDSALATVLLTIRQVNDPPEPAAQSLVVAEDGTLTIVLTAADADGDNLQFTVQSPPSHGTIQGTAPHLTYQPAADYHGQDSFSFQVSDGQVGSAPTLVALTVLPVNDPPAAKSLDLNTDENIPVSVAFAGSDVDGDKLLYSIGTPPAHGTVTGKGATRTYTPAAGFAGTDQFTYRVSDSQAAAEATVTIVVRSLNDPPTAAIRLLNLVYLVPGSTRGVIISPNNLTGTAILDGALSSDPDGDELQYSWTRAGAVFAQGVRTTNAFAVGHQTVTLRVEDGRAASTAVVEFDVVTAEVALGELIQFISQSGLPSQRVRPLLSSLEAAAASFARGNMNSGVNQLQAFQNKVQTQILPSDPELAAALQSAAVAILSAVGL